MRHFRSRGWDIDVVAPLAHEPPCPRRRSGGTRAFRRETGRHGENVLRVPYLPHPTTRLGRFADHCFSAAASVPAAVFRCARPDVVIATVPSLPVLLAGYLTAKARNVPFVVDMRDAWPDLARDARIGSGTAKGLAETAIDAIQARSDLVVTVTRGFAEALHRRGTVRVATVSNGVDTAVVPHLPPPAARTGPLEVLYLGNHGESQGLDVVIEAAALAGGTVHLTMVGHGVRRRELVALADSLDAPVTFHEPVRGARVMDFYRRADTCVVSLRADWTSFEMTIPSKTYELLAIGRHVTGIVQGEARSVIEQAAGGDIVPADAAAVAALWKELAEDRSRLRTGASGRDWVRRNASVEALAGQYMTLLADVAGRRRS